MNPAAKKQTSEIPLESLPVHRSLCPLRESCLPLIAFFQYFLFILCWFISLNTQSVSLQIDISLQCFSRIFHPSVLQPYRCPMPSPPMQKQTECALLHKFLQVPHKNIIKQMSEVEPQNQSEAHSVQNRFRSLQFKVKKPRAELQDYDLRQQIGEGGYGRVRRAIHRPSGETVAVKVLRVEACDPQQVQSIEGEILLQQRLMHEHIAQVYEVVRREKKIYIFMEYCPNGELFERIVKNGPMSEKEAARVFQQILSALLYLKRMGVSHRDIKPENVLFDKDWNAKLVDFGFGCRNYADDRMRKTLCGTPSYTPPEVLLRTEYNAQLMDVWSLGVTLYTMLAAEMPFEGDAEKRRARILACKWTAKNFFSPRVIRLLNGIFVEPTRRLLLADLQNSEFAQNYPVQEPAFVDAAKEVLVPEEGVLGILEREFGLSAKKVGESVKGYSLDRFRAHYYLVLARQMAAGQGLLGVGILTKYKKQRKSSASKLEPIARTPIKPNKTKDTDLLKVPLGQTENMRIRRGSVNLDPPTVRVRRERTPESPRKLKSSLALYE